MKKTLALVLTLILALSLCACGNSAPAPTAEPTPAESTATPEAVETPAPTEAPAASVTVNIYRGDDNAEYVFAEPVAVSELSPEALVSALKDAGVFSEAFTVNSFSADGSKLSLDLAAAFAAQLGQYGTAGEYIMMASLVNTFLEAYSADEITITVDGAVLETGHSIYDSPLSFFSDALARQNNA